MRRRSLLATAILMGIGLVASVGHSAPIVADNYYEERISPTCPQSFFFCQAHFSATPAGKVLMVERLACTVVSTQPIIESTIGVATTSNGSAVRKFPVAFAKTTQVENLHYYNVNEEVKIRIGPSRYPLVRIEYPAAGSANLECVIIGTLL
jgi:hypothetical protein